MLRSISLFARYLRRSYVLLAIGMLLIVLALPGRAQTSPVNLAPQGTIIAAVPIPYGSGGNPSFEVIRDGVKPPVSNAIYSALNSQQQYDTYNGNNQAAAATYLIKSDWIGYAFTTPQTFTRLVFQEGINFDTRGQYDQQNGGWFSGPLRVQVRQGGVWVDAGAVSTPAYPGTTDYTSYNTYTLNFPAIAGDAIRLYGVPGGLREFISVGELEVYGYPDATTAGSSLVKVSGDAQEGVISTTLPQPLTVQVYNNGVPAAGVTLNFSVTSGGGRLSTQTTTTDANGQASVNWQLGQSVYPQPNTVAVSGSGLNTVTFTARGTGTIRIMPLGDSITQGCCLPSYDGYRRPLWTTLNNAGYSVNFVGSLTETYARLQPTDDYDRNHEGHSGYRTDEILASISTWAQAARPDVVFIHLGSNDLFQNVSASTAINNLSQIIDRVRAVNPNVKLLLAKIQAVASGTAAFNQQIDTLASQKTSTNSPIVVVDHTIGWNNSTDTYDAIHPTAAGAQKMATNWLNGFVSALSGGSAVGGVSVSPASATVAVNATRQLTATVTPASATNKNVTWSSADPNIATVDASGLVTGKAVGMVTITATTQDGGKTATSVIMVNAATVAVTGVSVSPASATVAVNATTQLTATVTPANATNQTLTWSSAAPSIATVDASGLVTGKVTGTATISVTTQDGGKTATSAITVTPAASGGSLTGTSTSSSATVNLTTDGTTDWAHWFGYDRKASGGSKISNYAIVGSGTVSNYTNDLRTLRWSDGTPTASGSNKNGIYIAGINNGFQITAPADLTRRTLKVYVGGWNSGGTLIARLSDGSALDYVNTVYSSTGQYNAVYTLTYRAASASQTIAVKWVQASGSGNVTLQAATLR